MVFLFAAFRSLSLCYETVYVCAYTVKYGNQSETNAQKPGGKRLRTNIAFAQMFRSSFFILRDTVSLTGFYFVKIHYIYSNLLFLPQT